LRKEDGLIEFGRSATDIWNRLRGFQPWPGAFTTFRGKNLNVTAARPSASGSAVPDTGTLRVDCGQLLVGCGQGTVLELLEVQPEGKKRMAAKDFANGYRPAAGEKLGQ
jgi:methionyl-tRNA formyltransferase